MNNPFIKILSLIFVNHLLSGCSGGISNDAKQARTYEKRIPIVLEKTQDTLEISLSKTDDISLSESKIKSFLYNYDNYGKNSLVVTVPETGVEVGSARTAIKNIIDIAKKVGIKKEAIKIGTYQSLDNNNLTIRMSFEKTVAKTPDCSNNWSQNLTDAHHNELWKGHGCATRKNLAAIIANPDDLVRMPTIGVGSGARRTEVFGKYVLGESTTSQHDSVAKSTNQ